MLKQVDGQTTQILTTEGLNALSMAAMPAYLMNVPLSLNFDQPNNATMRSLSAEERKLNLEKAMLQFQELYSFVAQRGLVYLLPSKQGLQDQTYVSNVAAFLPHLNVPTAVLSNFRSDPRIGEEKVARPYLQSLGFEVVQAPEFFEGEADLKFLNGSTYVGAHGMRTSNEALSWMKQRFEMNIIPIRIKDPFAYHLDCVLFPLDHENTLVCTQLLTKDEIIEVSEHTNIIDVTYGAVMAMATNCLRIGYDLAAQTNISLYCEQDEMYHWEKDKISCLEQVCANHGLDLQLFDLTEFRKSGAALSCFIMKLNTASF